MKAKAIAWALFLGVMYGGYVAVSKWQNPLDRVSKPLIVDQLPKLPKGCGEECL